MWARIFGHRCGVWENWAHVKNVGSVMLQRSANQMHSIHLLFNYIQYYNSNWALNIVKHSAAPHRTQGRWRWSDHYVFEYTDIRYIDLFLFKIYITNWWKMMLLMSDGCCDSAGWLHNINIHIYFAGPNDDDGDVGILIICTRNSFLLVFFFFLIKR